MIDTDLDEIEGKRDRERDRWAYLSEICEPSSCYVYVGCAQAAQLLLLLLRFYSACQLLYLVLT